MIRGSFSNLTSFPLAPPPQAFFLPHLAHHLSQYPDLRPADGLRPIRDLGFDGESFSMPAIIPQVRSGALTATAGAERLGISRKTYYEWEDRTLQALASTAVSEWEYFLSGVFLFGGRDRLFRNWNGERFMISCGKGLKGLCCL